MTLKFHRPAATLRKLVVKRRPRNGERAQNLVEFALSLTVFSMLLFGTMQLAVIGNAALALSQLSYAGARYAAVNPSLTQGAIASYMKSNAAPTIRENNGANLTITVSPNTTPRPFGTAVTISVSYNLSSKLFLPNPFMGISFPTTLSNFTNTMMSE
jgi:Flp pilus assembly protein TadG